MKHQAVAGHKYGNSYTNCNSTTMWEYIKGWPRKNRKRLNRQSMKATEHEDFEKDSQRWRQRKENIAGFAIENDKEDV